MIAEQVARPVHAIERPASMAMLVKTARALKVLHGPDCRMTEVGSCFVFWTAGERCGCHRCTDDLDRVTDPIVSKADGWLGMVGSHGMIVCTTCGNKRCPHATDHRLECGGSNAPGQPGSVYGATPPPADSVRAYLADLPQPDDRHA